MTTPAASDITVRYECPGAGTEIWGMTQANFSVFIPGHHAKESAVNVTDAAARYLASELGREDTAEFRQRMATRIGARVLEQLAASGAHLDSAITISVAYLQEHPEILHELKAQEA